MIDQGVHRLRRGCIRTLASGLGALLLAGAAAAQLAQDEHPARAAVRQAVAGWLTAAPEVALHPELRRGIETMRDEAMPAMLSVADRWLAEMQRQSPQADTSRLTRTLVYRAINALALWQLDSAGPGHDRRLQQALLQPGICTAEYDLSVPMNALALLWRGIPRAQWAEHLRDETRLLSRFGDDAMPTALPAPIMPSVEDQAWRWLQDLARHQRQPAAPVPLALAWSHLVSAPAEGLRHDPQDLCLRVQWMLRHDLADPATALSTQRWASYRRGMLVRPFPGWLLPDRRAKTDDDYPAETRRLGLEGTVTVRLAADTQGRAVHAEVVGRALRLPELGATAPVAFERQLDAASLVRAMALPPLRPKATTGAGGLATRDVEFVYRLE